MIAALLKEMRLRQEYLEDEPIRTIYFGGGTPSLLSDHEIKKILDEVGTLFEVADDSEVTLEANPDDIEKEKLEAWKDAGINRLSIGVQSFFDKDLSWMNRAHNATQAKKSLLEAKNHYDNITIDLIYGTPELSNEKWKQNVETAISIGIPHLSCYALTVEPKTPLQKMIRLGQKKNVDQDIQSEQFLMLMDWLEKAGYEHYEISNFSQPGYRSRHNTSYWQGEKYLGIGPSAHSYNGESRQWNIANNSIYIQSLLENKIPSEKEILTALQKTNEYIMTSLRTMEGMNINLVDENKREELIKGCIQYIKRGLMRQAGNHFVLTKEGKLMADGIAADLFFI